MPEKRQGGDGNPVRAARERWEREVLGPARTRFPERQPEFKTTSQTAIDPLYGPDSLDGLDYERDLGFPGEYPFTRGVQPTMYRGRFWTMRQYAGYASAEESNLRYRYLLDQGQSGLSVAFDLPTQLGYDADDPLAAGEVGRVGVSICSAEDFERLFAGIPLEKVSVSITINASAAAVLAMLLAVAKRRGVPLAKLNGTTQNDILKEYFARGAYIFPPQPSLRLVVDQMAYCADEVPNWNTISISGYHVREAGSTAAQELAFTFADAICYVDEAIKRGLAVDKFAPRLAFFFNAHNDFFEEIAKFRAARRIWARLMRERFGAKDPRSWMLRFHTQTAGSTLTAQQPENNVVRVALQALAAVLGGTQSLHTNSMDEALALPSESAVRVALRTQQIIAHESGVANTVDPLGGSYFVESLTNQLEEEVLGYLRGIDQMGGTIRAITSGYFAQEIAASAYRYQREVEEGRRVVVGVNKYATKEQPQIELLRVDCTVQEVQIQRLAELRARRDEAKAQELLGDLERAARGDENLMPRLVACAEALCTLGEMCNVLRTVFGVYREAVVV
ncbi:MAG: acyl-CoA mutase large subunit family protein [Chloroflexota bacterium]